MKGIHYKKAACITIFLLLSTTIIFPNITGNTKTVKNPEPLKSDDWWTMYRHDAANTGCSSSEAPNTNQLSWYYDSNDEIDLTSPIIIDNNVIISTFGLFDLNILKNLTTLLETSTQNTELVNYFRNKIEKINDEYTGTIICLDAETGALKWRCQIPMPNAPAVYDNKIFVTSMDMYSYNSLVYCLDLNTGDIIWQKLCIGWSWSPTIVYENKVYIGSFDLFSYYLTGSYSCFDATTGDLLWRKNFGLYEWPIYAPASISEGRVLVAPTNIYTYSSTLYCLDAINGNYIWTKPIGYPGIGSPVLADGRVYISYVDPYSYDGFLKCLDITTGLSIWSRTFPDLYPTSGSALDDNILFLPGVSMYSGILQLYCIDSTNGSLIWQKNYTDHPYNTWFSMPAVADNKIYVTTDYSQELICINANDGNELWSYKLNQETMCPPSIADEHIFATDGDGGIYAFEDILKIDKISGGFFSVKANIVNEGTEDISNLDWTITVKGGLLGFINKTVNGTITTLSGESSLKVQATPLFGLGTINVIVTLQTDTINPFSKEATGFILGPLIIVR